MTLVGALYALYLLREASFLTMCKALPSSTFTICPLGNEIILGLIRTRLISLLVFLGEGKPPPTNGWLTMVSIPTH